MSSVYSLHDQETRKQLGQYFTGTTLAELLVFLSNTPKNKLCLDPMAGIGDMLTALINCGHDINNLYGIEIDPVASDICKKRIKSPHIQTTDAFSKDAYSNIPTNGLDLIITNPPYVRYQRTNKGSQSPLGEISFQQLRNNLTETINSFTHLDEEDKRLFTYLVDSFSGLSDLAVPSWILCASLVKEGGKIAMVVPHTWLNRDYALIIQYLLLKLFDVEIVVEDANSVWFPDAEIKTSLIIAKRRHRRSSVFSPTDKTYIYIKVFAPALGNTSIIQNLSYNQEESYKALASLLERKCNYQDDKLSTIFGNKLNSLINIPSNIHVPKWLSNLEEDMSIIETIPLEVLQILHCETPVCGFIGLSDLGITVGQGLRTGANKFFYLSKRDFSSNLGTAEECLDVNSIFEIDCLFVPSKYTQIVLQNQNELPKKLILDPIMFPCRVLYLRKYARATDIEKATGDEVLVYEPLPPQITDYINKAENTAVTTFAGTTSIPELSAVKPNCRIDKISDKPIRRYWYMLPALKKRHTPDYCIARVNYKSPNTYMSISPNLVIDANFSTLWLDDNVQHRKYAYFALLNSRWIKACLEAKSTILGGGALKVEASHLRKLSIPMMNEKEYDLLSEYGQILSKQPLSDLDDILDQIDCILLRIITGKKDVRSELKSLKVYLSSKISERGTFKNKRHT